MSDTNRKPSIIFMTCIEAEESYKCRVFKTMFPSAPYVQPSIGQSWIYKKDSTTYYLGQYIPIDFKPIPKCGGIRVIWDRIIFYDTTSDSTSLFCDNI